MSKGEPEAISGSTELSRSTPSTSQREKLAKRVEKLVGEAFNIYEGALEKLKELRPMIAQLRQQFMELKPGEKIAGCRTWTNYCEQVLHRSDRRIRQILKGTNPASQKHSRKSLPASKDSKALPQPMTVEMPEAQGSEWTPELVVDTSFNFVCSVFQKANLSHEDQNKAVEQLIDRLKVVVLVLDSYLLATPNEMIIPCTAGQVASRTPRPN
jgi:hypothetical protein